MKSLQGGDTTSIQPREAVCLQASLTAVDAHCVNLGAAGGVLSPPSAFKAWQLKLAVRRS